jgi:hypothetical protein
MAGRLRLHISTAQTALESHVEFVLDELRTGYSTEGSGHDSPLDVLVILGLNSGSIAQDTPHGRYVSTSDGGYISRWGFWDVRFDDFRVGGEPRAELRLSPDVDPGHYADGIRMFFRTVMASAAPLVDSLMFHGCAMSDPARRFGLLFLGASGDGKTTMASRLDGWTCLGDDTVLVSCPEPERTTVSGTPFAGSELHPRIACDVPLSEVCFLQPGAVQMRKVVLDPDECFGQLMGRLMWFVDGGDLREAMLDLMGRLASSLSAARLESSLHHDLSEIFDKPSC